MDKLSDHAPLYALIIVAVSVASVACTVAIVATWILKGT
jgi:hypothetical protein